MFDAKNSLDAIKKVVDKPQTKYWERLKDATGAMDVAQITWVMSQKEVKEAYDRLMAAFNSYIFERYKEDFAGIKAYQPLVDDYINTIIKSAEHFGQHAKDLEAENEKLKQQIAELMKNVK